jgi:hypothetical protein
MRHFKFLLEPHYAIFKSALTEAAGLNYLLLEILERRKSLSLLSTKIMITLSASVLDRPFRA